MSNAPKFSVVIPVYNKDIHIERCIRSVLEQNFSSFEVIVIDDCSTDNSRTEIQKFRDPRIVLLSRDRSGPGPGPARNLGIDAAKSEWCAFLDADDAWEINFLQSVERTARYLPQDVGFMFAGFRTLDATGNATIDPFTKKYGDKNLKIMEFAAFVEAWLSIHNSPNRTSATIIKTDILREVSGFPENEQGKRGGDKDTWLRVMTHTKAAYVPFLGMNYFSDSINMVTRNVTIERKPCICQTINQLILKKEFKHYSGILQELHNSEIMGYINASLRRDRKPRGLYRGFYVWKNPLKFLALLIIWILPERVVVPCANLIRGAYRTIRSAERKA